MFPQPQAPPPLLPEFAFDAVVPCPVCGQLRRPKLVARCWRTVVLGATMPETSLDEHRQARACERHIGSTGNVSRVNPVAHAHGSQGAAKKNLGPRVLAPNP